MSRKLIRFDWAMKKMLRHKANFGILEGFLSELFRFDVSIEDILESEGSPPTPKRGDILLILVRDPQNDLLFIELQCSYTEIPPLGVRGLSEIR